MNELLKRRLKCIYTKLLCRDSMLPLVYVDYFRSYHRILNLQNPETIGAKVQWIKKYGNLERYTDLADKYKVREYVKLEIGEKYLPAIYGVYNSSKEIELEKLPEKFALKCNHGSGEIYLCKDKNKLSQKEWNRAKKNLDKLLAINYFHVTGEKQYKDIERKIICEEYLEDDSGTLRDYKIYCFDGVPEYISVNVHPHLSNLTIDYFDLDWNKNSDFDCSDEKKSKVPIKKPEKLEEMLELARYLSRKFSYVRVDLRVVGERIIFGEFTFTSSNGTSPYANREKDLEIARLIDLENYR